MGFVFPAHHRLWGGSVTRIEDLKNEAPGDCGLLRSRGSLQKARPFDPTLWMDEEQVPRALGKFRV